MRRKNKNGERRRKKEFVGIATHQLRTPLTTIRWYVELLQSKDAGTLNRKQREALKEVGGSTEEMVRFINALLGSSSCAHDHLAVHCEGAEACAQQ